MSDERPPLADRLDAYFLRVLEDRMQGLTLVNANLSVESLGWRRYEDGYLGVLITPWCMNLIMLKAGLSESDAPGSGFAAIGECQQNGAVCRLALPTGEVDFMINRDDSLGIWLSCSLFSPMADFPNQSFAREVADRSLSALFGAPQGTIPAGATGQEANLSATEARRRSISSPQRREWFRQAFTRNWQ